MNSRCHRLSFDSPWSTADLGECAWSGFRAHSARDASIATRALMPPQEEMRHGTVSGLHAESTGRERLYPFRHEAKTNDHAPRTVVIDQTAISPFVPIFDK
jgi:hypothetical protein